jgi:hypothetical protein
MHLTGSGWERPAKKARTRDESALKSAKSLLVDIKKLEISKKSLSDPTVLHHLPFPFPHIVPEDRFPLDDHGRFSFMGRSVFPQLLGAIQTSIDKKKGLPINVYGTKGFGKSHVIAATVLLLLKEGKERVLFLPQARDMADKGPTEYLRRAALLTFADDDEIANKLLDCATVVDLTNELSAHSFILVSDQMNSLEEAVKMANAQKDETSAVIRKLGEKVLHIRGFSANNQTAQVFALTQRSHIDVTWFGGFDDAEFGAWVKHEQENKCLPPSAPTTRGTNGDLAAELKMVQDMTGAVPMYLNRFAAVWAEIDDDAYRMQHAIEQFLSEFAQDIEQQMEQFISNVVEGRNRYFKAADCFLRNDVLTIGGEAVDHRFFYKMSGSGRGAAVCGVARDLLCTFVRQEDDHKQCFLTEPWVNSCRGAVNVVVQGFIAEQIVISSVSSSSGIKLLFGDSDQSYFPTQDIVFTTPSAAVTKSVECVHYIPKPYNYQHVDSVIRSIDVSMKVCTIIALQPTLQTIASHKHSLKFFASLAFKAWESDLSDYTVDWHFVWIVRRREKDSKGRNYPKTSKASGGVPKFTQHCLSYEEVAASLDFL